jgi:YtkA-like
MKNREPPLSRQPGAFASAVTLLAALGLPGCGAPDSSPDEASQHDVDASTCAADPRASTYAAGMTKQSQDGKFTLQLQKSDPTPPAKGDNAWDVRLVDAMGAPVDGATIDVTTFMPDHGHGTSIDVVVTPASSGGGEYSISPVNLWMPGLWQVTLRTEAGGVTDDVVLGFCIAG